MLDTMKVLADELEGDSHSPSKRKSNIIKRQLGCHSFDSVYAFAKVTFTKFTEY